MQTSLIYLMTSMNILKLCLFVVSWNIKCRQNTKFSNSIFCKVSSSTNFGLLSTNPRANGFFHSVDTFNVSIDVISLLFFRELSSTFARLCRTVDAASTEMNEDLRSVESLLNQLEANQKQMKLLRNKANYITNELEIFENNYIKSNWDGRYQIVTTRDTPPY